MEQKYTNPNITTYHGYNQAKWNEFQAETVKLVVERFQNGCIDIGIILSLLGDRRSLIAVELDHKAGTIYQQCFGKLRGFFQIPGKDFSHLEEVDSESRWAHLLPLVRKKLEDFIEKPDFFSKGKNPYVYFSQPNANGKEFRLMVGKSEGNGIIEWVRFYYPTISDEGTANEFFQKYQLILYYGIIGNFLGTGRGFVGRRRESPSQKVRIHHNQS